MTSHIRCTKDDRIMRIEIDRPEKKNALTATMYQAMADALRAAEADPAVRVVMLHGRPDCFSAGNDLKDFLEHPHEGDDTPVSQFLRAIASAPKPLVAAVGGPVVGVGTTLLLHCDFVYATPEARFQLPFTPLGLVPEAGSSLLLPLAAGYQRAAELLLLGRPFDAHKAREAGIVTGIVPKAEVLDVALDTARALAALPPESVRLSKALLKKQWRDAVAERMAEESAIFRQRLRSPEAREAFSAFLEKRTADFSRF
jgi:enoyl-CoA hydratase/carnithine racemase